MLGDAPPPVSCLFRVDFLNPGHSLLAGADFGLAAAVVAACLDASAQGRLGGSERVRGEAK